MTHSFSSFFCGWNPISANVLYTFLFSLVVDELAAELPPDRFEGVFD